MVADIAIVKALELSEAIQQLTDGRVFNTARPEMDEQEDKIPYIVVNYQGMENEVDNKDMYEGCEDDEKVEVLCVARDRVQLANLMNEARKACRSFLNSKECYDEFRTASYQVRASQIMRDVTVPCDYQQLIYSISTDIS